MKVSNTWKPVLSEQITNACIPTKSIQIYVEHFQKYSPSNKAVRLFKYNASSTKAANEEPLMPSASSLSSFYSKCPDKERDLPTAVSKLIHIDLKHLTSGNSFDGAVFTSTKRNTKSNQPHIMAEQNSKKGVCNPEQPMNQASNHQKGNCLTSASKHAAPIFVNNVVYTLTNKKRRQSRVPIHIKKFSPQIFLEKLSKKSPPNSQQNKLVTTKTVQLPSTLATLRITSRTQKNSLIPHLKTETKGVLYKEGIDQTKTQINTRIDTPKSKLNCSLNNKVLPALNLPNDHSFQKNENKVNESHKNRDLLVFNEQVSKFQALHELIKVLREQKRNYPENTFLQQLHKKLKKDKCHFRMAKLEKLKEEVNASSSVGTQNNCKKNVKTQKQSFYRLKAFCSKVQPYSVVNRPTKTDLCALTTKVALSTNFKQNNSELTGRNVLQTQQNKIPSTDNLNNHLKHYALRGHIKLSSSNGRLFSHIHLKQGNSRKRGFIVDDLKINLIDLEKKIRKYTYKRITPLREESKFERKKFNAISRENTKVQVECSVRRARNSDDYKTSILQEDTGNKKTEFRLNRIRKDTNVSLPDSLFFKKQASFSTKLSDQKNLKTLENSILVKACFHDRQVKSVQSNNKEILQQQKPSTKENTVAQNIKITKFECNRKQSSRLNHNSWRVTNSQAKNCTSTSDLTQQCDNSPKTVTQGCSSTEVRDSKIYFKTIISEILINLWS